MQRFLAFLSDGVKDRQEGAARRDTGTATRAQTPRKPDVTEVIARAVIEGLKGVKGKGPDRPKAKEADKVHGGQERNAKKEFSWVAVHVQTGHVE